MKTQVGITLAALAFGFVVSASAGPITFTYTNPNGASATATFEANGDNLQITLTNTGSVVGGDPPVEEGTNALAAVFFNVTVNGDPELPLSPQDAELADGSSVLLQGSSTLLGVGDGWRYDQLATSPYAGSRVITAAGYGLSYSSGGGFSNFGSTPTKLDGSDWVIVPASYASGTGSGIFGSNPVVQNSIVFTLTGLPSGEVEVEITDVMFQYGTTLDGQHGGPVPEPGSLLLLGGGLAALWARSRRRRA